MKDVFSASKFLAIMNETVINIHVQGFLWGQGLLWEAVGGHKPSTPFGKYQGAQLLDFMVRVFGFFKKQPNYLPRWLYHFAFPLAMYESFCCFMSFPASGGVGFCHFKMCLFLDS